ncbi:hypothetical protein [Peribacillus muralis]
MRENKDRISIAYSFDDLYNERSIALQALPYPEAVLEPAGSPLA